MQPRTFEPRLVGWRRVEINDRGKAEREIGARNLRAIGSESSGWAPIASSSRAAERPKCTCESISPGMRNRPLPSIRAACGPATRFVPTSTTVVANDNICTKQRSGAFRRIHSDILDHYALINNALRASDDPTLRTISAVTALTNNRLLKSPPVRSRYWL